MTADLLDARGVQCPQCKTPARDERHLAFGYCEVCRDYTHIWDVVLNDTFVMPRRMGGGAMRCCTEPMLAWATVNRGPWAPGAVMPCLYVGRVHRHGHVLSRDGFWHSILAIEEDEWKKVFAEAITAGASPVKARAVADEAASTVTARMGAESGR